MTTTQAKPKARKKTIRHAVHVVIDPGTSLTKVIYVIDDGQVDWLTMGAEYMPIPASQTKSLSLLGGLGRVEDNAWFTTEHSDQCHLVGNSARQKNITTNIRKSKSELLEHRIVAAIGAIAVKGSLTNVFDLKLGLLIPYNELEEISSIKNWFPDLAENLSSFSFQGKKVKAKLKAQDFSLKPEGYGIIRSNSQRVKNKATAIVMAGHRNTSCLFVEKGNLQTQNTKTSMLGFFQVIEKLESKISYINEKVVLDNFKTKVQQIDRYLPEFGISYGPSETFLDFAGLIPSGSTRDINEEIGRIKLIYNQAIDEYLYALKNFLESTLASAKVEQVLFCGGASDSLSSHFNQIAADMKVVNLENKPEYNPFYKYVLYRKHPRKNEFLEEDLENRFADAWGFFITFSNYDLANKILNNETGK